MSDDVERAAYLMGERDSARLRDGERHALDRLGARLADEAAWAPVPADARARLLTAAAAGEGPGAEPPRDEAVAAPIDLSRRRRARQRAAWFGSGALVAAAAAVVAVVAAGGLAGSSGGAGPEVAASVPLTATELDPDAVATLDLKPTVAGVELELTLMGLDNTQGPDYYAAWLMGPDGDSVPLGSFHWRRGGVPIVLWSGVVDPIYDRFLVTRQVRGDGGARSDQVVLEGTVPELSGTADG